MHSYTEPREAILDYRDCLLKTDDGWEETRLEDGRTRGRTVIARFAGTGDRDQAARLVGSEIGVRREALPATVKGEYYWADLEGLEVVHRDGRSLGRVAYLLATGAHDVLVVQGDREVLVPFVPGRVILDVDVAAGVIEVDWEWD